MIREIVKDAIFLSQKAEPAIKEDISIAADLLDTVKFHADRCVGLAANMIGKNKAVIVVKINAGYLAMLNPCIVKKSAKTYEAIEGCLSHSGEKKVTRYESIEVRYQDLSFSKKREKFSGMTAEIIQHEIDHCNGILI